MRDRVVVWNVVKEKYGIQEEMENQGESGKLKWNYEHAG
jgi:hypothetical protein